MNDETYVAIEVLEKSLRIHCPWLWPWHLGSISPWP